MPNDLLLMDCGPRQAAPAPPAGCFVLEVDGTSKLLLEDASGCIAPEA